MTLEQHLQPVFSKYNPEISGDWNTLRISFHHPELGSLTIRSLADGDTPHLVHFRDQLGSVSRELFCPYPWNDATLTDALEKAVKKSTEGIDASFLMFHNDLPIGHFFLWKAGGNTHSLAHGVDIPELGIAIADHYHGKGLGTLQMELLKALARYLDKDAIELTTAMSNDAGWYTYLKAGFEYTGIIQNPLEVDVTETIAGNQTAQKYREERQMVLVINEQKREAVLDYLSLKRAL